MLQSIAKFILKLHGWKLDISVPIDTIPKCVMIAAPHTTNWDFYHTKIAFWALDVPMKFFIKDTWTKPWYGFIIKSMGGIGVNRLQRSNMVEYGVALLKHSSNLYLLNTPEGSRAPAPKWKTGFYHIAKQAQVPILLAYADYQKKMTGIGKIINLEGKSQEEVFAEIQEFYKDIKGKYPENFNPKIY